MKFILITILLLLSSMSYAEEKEKHNVFNLVPIKALCNNFNDINKSGFDDLRTSYKEIPIFISKTEVIKVNQTHTFSSTFMLYINPVTNTFTATTYAKSTFSDSDRVIITECMLRLGTYDNVDLMKKIDLLKELMKDNKEVFIPKKDKTKT